MRRAVARNARRLPPYRTVPRTLRAARGDAITSRASGRTEPTFLAARLTALPPRLSVSSSLRPRSQAVTTSLWPPTTIVRLPRR